MLHLSNSILIRKTKIFLQDNTWRTVYIDQIKDFIAQDNFPVEKSGFFAILDGHGGAKVSQYCVDAIPRIFQELYKDEKADKKNISQVFVKVCKQIDEELVKMDAEDVGTTACLVFLRIQNNKRLCTVGNLGDTRAVLCENGKAKRVTVDHKVSNQKQHQRIKAQGGCILQGRVGGQLAITRALGDLAFKTIGASNIPEIQEFEINEHTPFLIIASDGLWDVCDDQKAVEMVKEMPSTKDMSRSLMQYATKNGSKDNISVLVLRF